MPNQGYPIILFLVNEKVEAQRRQVSCSSNTDHLFAAGLMPVVWVHGGGVGGGWKEGSVTSCLLVGLGSPPPPLLGPQEMDPSLFACCFLTPHPKHIYLQIQHLEGK